MIDIKLLRDNTEEIFERLATRGVDRSSVDEVLDIDSSFRRAAARRDEVRAEVNKISKIVQSAMRSGDKAGAQELIEKSKALGVELVKYETEASALESERERLLKYIPNIPDTRCPIGSDESGNVVVRYWTPGIGDVEPSSFTLPEFPDYKRVPHWEVGEQLGILDLPRAAKISGSMFPMFKGAGAKLTRAMTAFAISQHEDAYLEVRPPTFVRRETMVSTGHLPKFEDDAYHMEKDDLFAIPTAEVPLTSMFKDEILEEGVLPMRLTAVTPCFRREAGSAGKDTRGLLRLHEFDKVELFACCTPEQSEDIFNDILFRAEEILRSLGLTYRVLELCTGDMGISSARTIDLEVYSPGVDRWLEVSSVSWFSDYQARRANLRFRRSGDGKPVLANTVNGSALAWARIWAAVVEVGRKPDGSVEIPECLVGFFGGVREISATK